MLWSNMAKTGGYAVGCAVSDNGEIDGNWIHQPEAVYKKDDFNQKDGGHAMLFTDKQGRLLMALHSPNSKDRGEIENARFIPMVDTGNSIEIKEVYESRSDLSNAIREFYLSVFNSIISIFRKLVAFFSAV